MKEMTIPTLQNAWLKSSLRLNRIQIFNCLIFRELLKSIAACIGAKEVVSDMLEAYENACAEDTALEAAMTVFSKKKQLQYVEGKSHSAKPSPRGSSSSRNFNRGADDLAELFPKLARNGDLSASTSHKLPALNFSQLPSTSLNVRKSSRYE